MDNKAIHTLINNYLSGKATKEEIEKLHDWYQQSIDTDSNWVGDSEEEVRNRMFKNIKVSTQNRANKSFEWKYVVSAAILLMVAIFSYIFLFPMIDKVNYVTKVLPEIQQENRYILLPDSSVVILKPGSELKYPSEFEGEERYVELRGDAYFDIKHRSNQPFVIKTGKVKTTVLGTAFSIKTNKSDEVEVFVNRGKVRVDYEDKVMGVLTANHKLVCNNAKKDVQQAQLPEIVEDEFVWVDTELDFDAMPFEQIAEKLEQRYDTKIIFQNKDLLAYEMSGSFSGISSLEEILAILTKTSNSTFNRVDENKYEISKK